MNNNNINILITLNHKFPELICNKIIDYKINYDIIDILYFINVNYIVIKELIQENSKIKKKIKKIELDLMSKNKSSNDFKSLTIKNERLKNNYNKLDKKIDKKILFLKNILWDKRYEILYYLKNIAKNYYNKSKINFDYNNVDIFDYIFNENFKTYFIGELLKIYNNNFNKNLNMIARLYDNEFLIIKYFNEILKIEILKYNEIYEPYILDILYKFIDEYLKNKSNKTIKLIKDIYFLIEFIEDNKKNYQLRNN